MLRSLFVCCLALGLASCLSENEASKQRPAAQGLLPAVAKVGQLAPDFSLSDHNGRTVTLSELRGRTVVLEWFNPSCPHVKYAYTQGPLQAMTEKHAEQDVVWLCINSQAPGRPGSGVEISRTAMREWNMNAAVLFDSSGDVARRYQAQTTPHFFVVNPEGFLVYRGALDNGPLGSLDGTQPVNYVENALYCIREYKSIDQPTRQSYGCPIQSR